MYFAFVTVPCGVASLFAPGDFPILNGQDARALFEQLREPAGGV
jgi:hypothetical protein